jgi:hypothetical protein
VNFDLYVWHEPRDMDAATAGRLAEAWEADRAEAAAFSPSVDLGWFLRELAKDEPNLDLDSDVPPSPTGVPIWLAPDDPPAARIVAIRLPRDRAQDVAEEVFGLAAKYDLVVLDPSLGRVVEPLAAMAAYASATFWPSGAIRAAAAGAVGLVAAVVAWSMGIPVVSGLVALVGGFLFVMAALTFVHEGRVAWRRRSGGGWGGLRGSNP